MTLPAHSPMEYLEQVPLPQREALRQLRQVIIDHLDQEMEETMANGMIAYVVPHRVYPAGYHVSPKSPLPFISLAAQKNYLALYHFGLYTNPELLEWWVNSYAAEVKHRLDMGKSCIRFKQLEEIPYALVGELVSKMTTRQWIALYEKSLKR
ncbi:MAG: DUF1801 domain-containing protein [Cytophagales bacterium]|nr:DUF1801 domain-containing protein [Cytophagales bacterium]